MLERRAILADAKPNSEQTAACEPGAFPTDPPPDASLRILDPGERAAISLALSLGAGRILIDDWDGRAEAVRRKLRVTGTLALRLPNGDQAP